MVLTTAPAARVLPASCPMHIADALIAERAPRLTSAVWWPLVRPAMYRLLNYFRARRMADAIQPLSGRDAMAFVSDLLSLKVETRGLEHVPPRGRCVVICNHPTGIADGVAVFDALKPVRPDLIFYANADALRVCPRLGEVVIPVEWVEGKRTREKTRVTLKASQAAFEAERPLVVFPAGRIARRAPDGRLCDPEWQPTALSLARKHDAPIVPIHVAGPWSTLFHFFNRFSPELRDITLFHELLNKRGRRFSLTIGPAIPSEALGPDLTAANERLKRYIELELPSAPDRHFNVEG
jgi:putative hemolysin